MIVSEVSSLLYNPKRVINLAICLGQDCGLWESASVTQSELWRYSNVQQATNLLLMGTGSSPGFMTRDNNPFLWPLHRMSSCTPYIESGNRFGLYQSGPEKNRNIYPLPCYC